MIALVAKRLVPYAICVLCLFIVALCTTGNSSDTVQSLRSEAQQNGMPTATSLSDSLMEVLNSIFL